MDNHAIADRFREMADLLAQQDANPFRVSAYRHAADTLAELECPASEILAEQGTEGLVALPAIGRSLAAAIAEMVQTGRWIQLERLRGSLEPEQVFRAVPGIGPELAERIHDTLGVDTLEALEQAAHDGRLDTVPGIGPRRTAIIRAALSAMLGQRRPRGRPTGRHEPSVSVLLEVDRAYREAAAADTLRKIAPRRFNPEGEAWLPIMHDQRGDWHFTVLFSNTARAHQFGRIRDWVVVFFHTDDEPEGQCTIVTERQGVLAGKRVVRGREAECRDYYRGRDG